MFQKINAFICSPATAVVICFLALASLDTIKGWETFRFPDAQDYINAANTFKATGHYPRQGSLSFFRPPLYPMLIAALWSILPQKIAVLKIAQIVLHLLTVGCIMKIAREFRFTKPQIFCAGLFYGLDPFIVQNATDIQTEPLQAFLTAAALLGFFRFISSSQNPQKQAVCFATSAWLLGLASLCRPSALPIGLVCGFFVCLLPYHTKADFNRYVRLSVLYYLSFFAAILPWTFYNRYNLGEWILITDGGGYHLWLV